MGRIVMNVLEGMGSVFDISSMFEIPTISEDPAYDDMVALRGDWEQVGADLRYAMGKFRDGQRI